MVGAFASVASGGKFADGARAGAFGYLFNHCAHDPDSCGMGSPESNRQGLSDTPADGMATGLWGGVFSYVDGIREYGEYRLALSGALGADAQMAAQGYANSVSAAVDWAQKNPDQLARALYTGTVNLTPTQEQQLRVQMGTRLALASGISTVNGFVGVPLAAAAIRGNMITAAKAGASQLDILRAGGFGR
jgi:hypothetical protein